MGGGWKKNKTKQTYLQSPALLYAQRKKLLNIILYFCIKQIGCDAQTCA